MMPMMEPTWLVWTPATNYTARQHKSEKLARTEAERLAHENPGTEFFVLTTVAKVTVNAPVQWTETDHIPF